jgi:hypothetical protein
VRKQIVFFSSLLILLIFFSPLLSEASDVDLERGLQNDLEQSKAVIGKSFVHLEFWLANMHLIQNFVRAADESSLRLALKVIRVVSKKDCK